MEIYHCYSLFGKQSESWRWIKMLVQFLKFQSIRKIIWSPVIEETFGSIDFEFELLLKYKGQGQQMEGENVLADSG